MPKANYNGRYLPGNKSCQVPRSLVFFDCETTPIQDAKDENIHHLKLRLGVAKYLRLELGKETREQKIVFRDSFDFWQFLCEVSSPQRLTLAFAHNAIFDLCTNDITDAIHKYGWIPSAPYASRDKDTGEWNAVDDNFLAALDCPPFLLCIQNVKTNARVLLLDTLNYFNCSLAELGETVGLPKLPICFDSCDDEELREYCERDVDIIKTAILSLIKWQSDLDLGNFRWTLPSNSYNAFRHRFLKHKIVLHDHAEAKTLERLSYFGGQTEVFSTLKHVEPVYLLDVRSLYPSVMLNNCFPVKLLDYQENLSEDFKWEEHLDSNAIAKVTLSTPVFTFPAKRNDATVYEKDEFTTYLAGPELEFALSNGLIMSCQSFATYECQPIFTEFVEYFWGMRQRYEANSETIWANLCKLFLNSLSGKFAQKTAAWKSIGGILNDRQWSQWVNYSLSTGRIDQFRSIGNRVQIKVEQGEHKNSFCAISAFITSFGRERLRLLRGFAGQENVYYQGVDSLVVNNRGYSNLLAIGEIDYGTLGRLRLVESSQSFHARGKMDYTFGERRIVAGLKRNAIETASDEFSQTIFSGSESLFKPAGERQITTTETTFHRRKPPQV